VTAAVMTSATTERSNGPVGRAGRAPAAPRPTGGVKRALDQWVAIQGINLVRHARSLRDFVKGEFGVGPAAPSEAHVEAVNRFIARFRGELQEAARWVEAAASAARREPTPERLALLLNRKQSVGNRVLYAEGIWDFYFDLFVQRLSSFGERLRAVDRIAASCYEDVFVGLGTAQPTPSLLPFSYASSGFSPLTYRRGVPLRRLRHHPNLFPLIMLPQHRLDAVWALSSVLHEVSHNLQADLGLWDVMPKMITQRLTAERVPEAVAKTWSRWHKEISADLFALVLGGPGAIESLMDVVGRSRQATLAWSPTGVHPTPYLRPFISLVLLRRLGFPERAAELERMWRCLYASGPEGYIPRPMLDTFETAVEAVVDTIVFQQHSQLAGKSLAKVVEFGPNQLATLELAGRRLAAGHDVGTVPARFMISAARYAIENQLASPQAINDNFYRTLGRR
jgi:hypothetical protein